MRKHICTLFILGLLTTSNAFGADDITANTDWERYRQRIYSCQHTDARCVGNALLDAMQESSGNGGGAYSVWCACDSDYSLHCTVGRGLDQTPVQGSVVIGSNSFCTENIAIVKKTGRFCNVNYDLYQVDVRNAQFAKILAMGSRTRCLEAANSQE